MSENNANSNSNGGEARIDSAQRLVRDYGGAVAIAIAIALLIRVFIIEAYRIPSATMKPTLDAGDTIFVSKSAFGIRWPWSGARLTKGQQPERGDVVVYSLPEDPNRDYIKRVVGISGDTVEIKQGKLILNQIAATVQLGRTQTRDAVCSFEKISAGHKEAEFEVCREPPLMGDVPATKVGDGFLFVLGDARTEATDSRSKKNWASVPISSLKGKALWIWLSIEPPSAGESWFSRIRFERMLREIR